jgi:hypothetical protein
MSSPTRTRHDHALGAPVEPSPSRAQTKRDPRPSPRPQDELIGELERDQFVAETSRPVARAALGRLATRALWALRVFVLIAGAMVIYTFIDQLH